ncbi:hypothetical protein GCM10009544_59310 [Streptomyces stramineus]|uniref:Uncharacterized protein n=1 Tax=Streptomyces stramineus TaxID=173861 RepID=A0ABP3L0C8_9ACTN
MIAAGPADGRSGTAAHAAGGRPPARRGGNPGPVLSPFPGAVPRTPRAREVAPGSGQGRVRGRTPAAAVAGHPPPARQCCPHRNFTHTPSRSINRD